MRKVPPGIQIMFGWTDPACTDPGRAAATSASLTQPCTPLGGEFETSALRVRLCSYFDTAVKKHARMAHPRAAKRLSFNQNLWLFAPIHPPAVIAAIKVVRLV